MIKVDNLKLPIGHTEDELYAKLEKELKLNKFSKDLNTSGYSCRIFKRSLDARRKPELFYVYSLLVTLDNGLEDRILKHVRDRNISSYKPVIYQSPGESGSKELTGHPVIVGAGPSGLFCAYELSRRGYAPIVIERGERVENRIETVKKFFLGGRLNTESNVQFGEGGAGTFSDGKLNTGVNDKMGRNRYVLDTLVRFGAPEEITYSARPHIGTDILALVVRNMREEIIRNGGQFLFDTRMTGFEKGDRGIENVCVVNDGNESAITSNCMVLAIGHSSRDTFKMLKDRNVDMEAKAFAVGLRIQHPQEMIDLSQYGRTGKGGPGPADYKLTNRTAGGRNVYSFCMCPGGYVVNASSEAGRLCVNGMSYSGRSSLNANSAIIVSVNKDDFKSDDVLAGMEFQRRLEERAYTLGGGAIPVQEYGDFKRGTLSGGGGSLTPQIKGNYKLADLRELLPDELNEAIIESIDKFGYTIEGFDRDDAILAGVESRTSSPVRILRNDNYEGSIEGLYPCGEGAGYAGGITSAGMDGIKVAEAIMKKYRPAEAGR